MEPPEYVESFQGRFTVKSHTGNSGVYPGRETFGSLIHDISEQSTQEWLPVVLHKCVPSNPGIKNDA